MDDDQDPIRFAFPLKGVIIYHNSSFFCCSSCERFKKIEIFYQKILTWPVFNGLQRNKFEKETPGLRVKSVV